MCNIQTYARTRDVTSTEKLADRTTEMKLAQDGGRKAKPRYADRLPKCRISVPWLRCDGRLRHWPQRISSFTPILNGEAWRVLNENNAWPAPPCVYSSLLWCILNRYLAFSTAQTRPMTLNTAARQPPGFHKVSIRLILTNSTHSSEEKGCRLNTDRQ